MSNRSSSTAVLLLLLIVRGVQAAPGAGPGIVHSTYLGGIKYDKICALQVDGAGNTYVVGESTSRDDFLADATVIGRIEGGAPATFSEVLFVAKISPDGGSLKYLTVVGGGDSERCGGLALLDDGSVIVVGHTESNDFPLLNPAQAAFLGPLEGFAFRLMPDGQSLAFSTYILGTIPVAVDGLDGGAVIVGRSEPRFVTVNAIQEASDRLVTNSFVMRVTAQGAIVFATFFGEMASNQILDVAVGADEQIYFGGFTFASDLFPGGSSFLTVTPAFNTGFVAVLSGDGQTVWMSELLGGTGQDQVNGVAVRDGAVFVTGTTSSDEFPTTSGSFKPKLSLPRTDSFLAKITSPTTAPTTARGRARLEYSTYFGPAEGVELVQSEAVAVDSKGRAIITGSSFSSTLPLTDNALDDCTELNHCSASPARGADVFVTMFSADGSSLAHSTYFGAAREDDAFDIELDAADDVYLAGRTASFLFPLVNPIRDPHTEERSPDRSRFDGFLARLTRLDQPAGPAGTPTPQPTPTADPGDCSRSCDGSGPPRIADLVRAVAIALGTVDADCDGIDRNGDGDISIAELVRGVGAALGAFPECL